MRDSWKEQRCLQHRDCLWEGSPGSTYPSSRCSSPSRAPSWVWHLCFYAPHASSAVLLQPPSSCHKVPHDLKFPTRALTCGSQRPQCWYDLHASSLPGIIKSLCFILRSVQGQNTWAGVFFPYSSMQRSGQVRTSCACDCRCWELLSDTEALGHSVAPNSDWWWLPGLRSDLDCQSLGDHPGALPTPLLFSLFYH